MTTDAEKIEVQQWHLGGGKVDIKYGSRWYFCCYPEWNWIDSEYRKHPEPEPLVERWGNVYASYVVSHPTEAEAKQYSSPDALRTAVHMREAREGEVMVSVDDLKDLMGAWHSGSGMLSVEALDRLEAALAESTP